MTERRPIRWFLSARDAGARLSEMPPLAESAAEPQLPSVWIDAERRFQTLFGFGGAFTEASAVTWLRLSAEKQARLLAGYFDRATGHGYRICRVHMGSCDFSLGHYAHVETREDFALESFSIERDRRALLPMIKAAQRAAGEPFKLLATPWSPPAWMKTNGRMNGGGSLRPDCRRAWARCFVRFIQAYAAEGVPIWGVSVQNEPAATQTWDSCLYTAAEERDFVRDFLGPELEAAGLGAVKILVWDHNRDLLVERAGTVYADDAAARYVWGAAFHWYGEDHFDQAQQLHDAWPDKQLLFTEGCQEGGPHHGSWDLGERYARSMIADLNRWTVGWIDWNMLLDHDGGPNHVGNHCSAPMLLDAAGTSAEPQSSYFYIGHFARFFAPGARRVLCASARQDLETLSCLNPDGSLAVVIMNRTESAQRFALRLGDNRTVAALPPRAIATYILPATRG